MDATRDVKMLARLLISYEAMTFHTPESIESIVVRVYEKLRISLCAFAGVAAFRSFASRALALSRPRAPNLVSAYIDSDGYLCGLGDSPPLGNIDKLDRNGHSSSRISESSSEEGIILIAQILGLLFIFLGDTITLSLLRDAWPVAAFDEHSSGHGRTQ